MQTLELQKIAKEVRKGIVTGVHSAKAGHPGGSLSAADIFTYLYFEEMNIDPKNPTDPDRDRFVLSKGHTAPGYYSAMAQRGYFPVEELLTLRHVDSRLQGHPCMQDLPGIDMSSGSLGQGISAAVGMAIAKRNNNDNHHVYAILGDGEMQEGQIWESLLQAAHYKLNNLIVVIDYNKLSSFDAVNDSMNLEPLVDKIRAFNFHVIELDGNNMEQVVNGLNEAHIIKDKPVAIIANTVKGKGVSFMENNPKWHSGALSDEEYKIAMQELQMEEE